MARVFQRAGYATGAFGKWGLGPVGSTGDPNRHGFDLFHGYNCQAVAHSFYPPHLWRNSERLTLNARPIPGHQAQPEGEVRIEDWIGENYAPEQMLEAAVRFQRHKVIRQGLLTKRPGPWEVYDLGVDPGEAHDLAATRSDLIRQAETVLREEVADNAVFPLTLPGTP